MNHAKTQLGEKILAAIPYRGSLPGAGRLWNNGRMKALTLTALALVLTGCGNGPGRLSGGTASGAATGAIIGIAGGPAGVVLGAGIGAGVGAITSSNTTPKQVNLGPPPWAPKNSD